MHMIHSGAAASVLAALVLAGCSSGPEISVRSSGTIPANGAFALVDGVPGDVNRSVCDILTQGGLTVSKSPHYPDYVVQVSVAMRPAGTGLLVQEDKDLQWLRHPDFYDRNRLIASLGMSITEVASGREHYRASASGRLRSKGSNWVPLLQAILRPPQQKGN
jgi:hypothetical protein